MVLQRGIVPSGSSSLFLRQGTGNHEPWEPGTVGRAQAQLSARAGFSRELQSPALTALQLMDPALAQLLRGGEDVEGPFVIDHLQEHGQGSHGRHGGAEPCGHPEPALPVSAGPARCSRDRDKEVKISPLPRDFPLPSLTFGVPGVHWVPAGQAAGLGAECAACIPPASARRLKGAGQSSEAGFHLKQSWLGAHLAAPMQCGQQQSVSKQLSDTWH